jgi:hypothetical protein
VPDAPLKASRGPFTSGYTSAVEPIFARPEQLVGETDGVDANSSRDCTIDPFTGGVSKRAGCAVQGDTLTFGGATTGILDAHWNAKARKGFRARLPQHRRRLPRPRHPLQ